MDSVCVMRLLDATADPDASLTLAAVAALVVGGSTMLTLTLATAEADIVCEASTFDEIARGTIGTLALSLRLIRVFKVRDEVAVRSLLPLPLLAALGDVSFKCAVASDGTDDRAGGRGCSMRMGFEVAAIGMNWILAFPRKTTTGGWIGAGAAAVAEATAEWTRGWEAADGFLTGGTDILAVGGRGRAADAPAEFAVAESGRCGALARRISTRADEGDGASAAARDGAGIHAPASMLDSIMAAAMRARLASGSELASCRGE